MLRLEAWVTDSVSVASVFWSANQLFPGGGFGKGLGIGELLSSSVRLLIHSLQEALATA